MKRTVPRILVLAIAAMGCGTTGGAPPAHRMGASGLAPGMFHVIPVSLDPSVSGLPGAVGDLAQGADGLHAWQRSGPNITDWVSVPTSGGGQDPAAVVITGGSTAGITIDGVASSLIAGDITGLDPFWARAIAAEAHLKSKVGALTKFKRISPGAYDLGIDTAAPPSGLITNLGVADGNQNGGSVTPKTAHYMGFGTTVIQNPKTTPWGLYLRGTLVPAKGSSFGLQGTSSYVMIGSNSAVNTKWQIQWGDGTDVIVSSSGDADTSEHDFYFYFDGTTGTMEVDGVTVATNADLTHWPALPQVIAAYNTTTAGTVIKEIVFGY